MGSSTRICYLSEAKGFWGSTQGNGYPLWQCFWLSSSLNLRNAFGYLLHHLPSTSPSQINMPIRLLSVQRAVCEELGCKSSLTKWDFPEYHSCTGDRDASGPWVDFDSAKVVPHLRMLGSFFNFGSHLSICDQCQANLRQPGCPLILQRHAFHCSGEKRICHCTKSRPWWDGEEGLSVICSDRWLHRTPEEKITLNLIKLTVSLWLEKAWMSSRI